MTIWQDMLKHLGDLSADGLLRQERVLQSPVGAKVVIDGREVLCLCSNDYLGLAGDLAIKSAAIEAIEKWGVGAGASRLISGTSHLHVQLQDRIAKFKHLPSAIVTPTGWMANHIAIHALATSGDLILCDKLNHASIIDAALSSGARVRTFSHRDTGRAEELLKKHRSQHRRCLIVTDSLFSMDGDIAPLKELAELKNRYDAQLLIDEAHATGVMGTAGRGVAEMLGAEGEVDVVVGTLSKAIGAMGGFIAGPTALIDVIRNTGRPYIYTTAIAPALCAAALTAMDIIDAQPTRRIKLLKMADQVRSQLRQAGLNTGESVSQIIPIMIGDAGAAMDISRQLLDAGFLVPAIRPPTVPKGTSRLRVSLSSLHDQADLDRFVQAVIDISRP
jgi:8-amino-7-oxononanoate synthase